MSSNFPTMSSTLGTIRLQSFFVFVFLAVLRSLQDLSTPTRDWAQAMAVKAQNPNH